MKHFFLYIFYFADIILSYVFFGALRNICCGLQVNRKTSRGDIFTEKNICPIISLEQLVPSKRSGSRSLFPLYTL